MRKEYKRTLKESHFTGDEVPVGPELKQVSGLKDHPVLHYVTCRACRDR